VALWSNNRRSDVNQVGEPARRAGMTVRTLPHYEQTRLLIPPARSAALYPGGAMEREPHLMKGTWMMPETSGWLRQATGVMMTQAHAPASR
jgi:hypothetical protein